MSVSAPGAPTTRTRSTRPRRRRSAASVLGNLLLDLAAIGGAVCIVLVILAYGFNMTLIMFKTGSMSPGIPTGSLALVQEIPAADIEIGDVVTVDRAGKLPVTHRVTAIAPGTSDEMRVLTMKGDANGAEDPYPYEVSSGRVLLASVPGLAYVVIWFSNPWVLAGLTVACATLVMWAFWPRTNRRRRRSGEKPSSRRGTGTATVGLVAVIVSVGASVWGAAPPAHAAPHVDVVTGDAVVMTTVTDRAAMASLQPGTAVPWEVGITTKPDASAGVIDVWVAWTGSPDIGLRVVADTCTERWARNGCRGTATRVLAESVAPVDGVPRVLLSMPSEQAQWVRFSVSVPGDDVARTESASLTVTADGMGDELTVSPDTVTILPATGQPVGLTAWMAVAAVALGLIGAGIAALRVRARVPS